MGGNGKCVYNEIVAEPLTKENHEEWFEWIKNYLIARDLWEVIDGNNTKPPENKDHNKDFVRWRRKNAAALHVIHISCGPHSFSHIKGVSEAKVAWDILKYTYNPPMPEPKLEPESEQPKPTSPQQVMEGQVDFNMADLYKHVCDSKWVAIKEFLDKHPGALNAKFPSSGRTVLHEVAIFGHVNIVEELVRLVPPQSLEIVDAYGWTPLALAARFGGDTQVVKCIVNKNKNALGISSYQNISLPVTLAFVHPRNKEMARYLYSVTPLESLKPEKGLHGSVLLEQCFATRDLDVALDLLQRCEELLFATNNAGWGPILGIASMPSAFFSESQLVFWKRWIYKNIHIPSTTTNFARVDIQQKSESKRVQGLGLLRRFTSNAYNLLGVKEICELKLLHVRAAQILSLLCRNISFLVTKEQDAIDVVLEALFCAAREGNVEFVVQVTKAYPHLIMLHSTNSNWNTFFYAIEYRQAKVFNLIHGYRFKDSLTSNIDDDGNTLLHVAGKLAPSFQLNRIPGPALQMQREIQWFKEVERVVPPGFKELKNGHGKQPEDIFKESHEDLRMKGEKWMKDTASSCSVVGALVVTIMFAAAFAVPGGNNQDFGYPIFLKEKLFAIFIISDALSLFSSSTSVLMFLGILTSRYAEEDFLESLPTKLITGLSTLFLSIVTMMVAFSSCILIMLQHTYSMSFLPIIMLASVPVTLFVLLQFPLLVQIVSSTYGPGIFKRNVKLWL